MLRARLDEADAGERGALTGTRPARREHRDHRAQVARQPRRPCRSQLPFGALARPAGEKLIIPRAPAVLMASQPDRPTPSPSRPPATRNGRRWSAEAPPRRRRRSRSRQVYRVKRGDTLSSIARLFETSVDGDEAVEPAALNRINPGQRLTIYTAARRSAVADSASPDGRAYRSFCARRRPRHGASARSTPQLRPPPQLTRGLQARRSHAGLAAIGRRCSASTLSRSTWRSTSPFGLPALVLVGLPDASVRESRDRVRIGHPELRLRVPAAAHHGQPRAGRRAQGRARRSTCRSRWASWPPPAWSTTPTIADTLIVGELSLDGSMLPTRGVLPIAALARQRGFTRLLLPAANAAEAAMVDGLDAAARPTRWPKPSTCSTTPRACRPRRSPPAPRRPTADEPTSATSAASSWRGARSRSPPPAATTC